jgi:hypothetical protein
LKKYFKKKLIFFQSPTEIVDIIHLISRDKFGTFIIIVTGGEPLTNIIKKLKLRKKFGVSIFEYHTLRLINPINIIKIYFKLYLSNQSKKILQINYEEVIFFSYAFDFITPFFLAKTNAKKYTYINIYKEKFLKKKISFKPFIQKLIYKIFYKKLKIIIGYDKKFKKFFFYQINKKIFTKHAISKIPKPIFQLPSFKKSKTAKVIYIDGGQEILKFKDFKKILLNLFLIIKKKNYDIIVKKHPQNDLSNSVEDNKVDFYILDPIPIELYNMSKVKYVFGFVSTGLAKIASNFKSIKVISIIDLIVSRKSFLKEASIADKRKIYLYKKYMQSMKCRNKLYYPKNFNEIKKLLNS